MKPRYLIARIKGWAYERECPTSYVTFYSDGTASRHIRQPNKHGRPCYSVTVIPGLQWNEKDYLEFIPNEAVK